MYKKSPHKYHTNLKAMAGLQPKANEQLNFATIRVTHTNKITSGPQIILDTLQTRVATEQSRVTPDDLSIPPWQDPTNPDTPHPNASTQ